MNTVGSAGTSQHEPERRARGRESAVIWIVLALVVTFAMGVGAGRWAQSDAHLIVQCAPAPAHTVTVHPHTSPTFSCNH